MCAIVDVANVHGELWDRTGIDAGRGFRKAVEKGQVPLVRGGSKFTKELIRSGQQMQRWFAELQRGGRLTVHSDEDVDAMEADLLARRRGAADACESDDHHIIALARATGARLLYTNDSALQADFDNKRLVDSPRGKVYSTSVTSDFSRDRRRLLAQTDLCRTRTL